MGCNDVASLCSACLPNFCGQDFPLGAAVLQDLTDTCRQMAGWPEPEGVTDDLTMHVLSASKPAMQCVFHAFLRFGLMVPYAGVLLNLTEIYFYRGASSHIEVAQMESRVMASIAGFTQPAVRGWLLPAFLLSRFFLLHRVCLLHLSFCELLAFSLRPVLLLFPVHHYSLQVAEMSAWRSCLCLAVSVCALRAVFFQLVCVSPLFPRAACCFSPHCASTLR